MKKIIYLLSSMFIIALITISCQKESFDDATTSKDLTTESFEKVIDECNNIQSETIHLTYYNGELKDEIITIGFMENGYNYQAHMYNGDYGTPGVHLVMKWNDAWLSNKDCGTQIGREGAFSDTSTPDQRLDRHYPFDSYQGSGAWLTNHWTETYIDEDGNECTYSEFIKIIAPPLDAYLQDGYWYTADNIEIGEEVWGQFAIIQLVVNDPCGGSNGLYYNSPDHSGFGGW